MFFLTTNQVKPDSIPSNFGDVIKKHIAWVEEKIKQGVVMQAGKWGETRGMCIIKADSLELAEEILATDPLIASGATDYILDVYYSNVPLD